MRVQMVQHRSGQGEQWEVVDEDEESWTVLRKTDASDTLILPKSEYVLVGQQA